MAPKKRPTKRLTGSGAAKASATALDEAEAAEAAAMVAARAGECVLPADPEDERLTVKGLVLGGDGKVDVFAYEDLAPAYAKEPPPDQHPDPEKPGVRRGERIPKGLRVWDDIRAGNSDKDGAGWIAVRSASQHEKKKEKWFNIRTCGSWRMAFLLARLQRLYWDERAEWLKQNVPAIGSGAASSATSGNPGGKTATADGEARSGAGSDVAALGGKEDGQPPATPPPKAKRPRAAPAAAGAGATAEEGEASKKVAKRGGGQRQAAAEKTPPAAQPPGKLIGAATLAGSARLQQILAARQQQQQQQEQQQQPQQPPLPQP